MPDPQHVETRLSKRTLVVLSHAIERLALAAAEDGPVLVFALFQRRPYYERERAVYERIAARSAVTIIGLVEPPTSEAMDIRGAPVVVRLTEQDELTKEWSVVVLTPRTGAALVARDLERVDDDADTLEGGRLFDGRWSFRRDDALHEARRLQKALAGGLSAAVLDVVDAVVERVRELPSAPGESRVDASMRFLVGSVQQEQARTAVARRRLHAAPTADEQADEIGDAAAQRWIGTARNTASGTLPVALLAVEVVNSAGGMRRAGRRGVGLETVGVLRVLQQLSGPADRTLRLADGQYLLVMPSLSETDVIAAAHRVSAGIAALQGAFPFAAVHAVCAVTVTRQRPLPIEALQSALAWAVAEGVAVATLPADRT